MRLPAKMYRGNPPFTRVRYGLVGRPGVELRGFGHKLNWRATGPLAIEWFEVTPPVGWRTTPFNPHDVFEGVKIRYVTHDGRGGVFNNDGMQAFPDVMQWAAWDIMPAEPAPEPTDFEPEPVAMTHKQHLTVELRTAIRLLGEQGIGAQDLAEVLAEHGSRKV